MLKLALDVNFTDFRHEHLLPIATQFSSQRAGDQENTIAPRPLLHPALIQSVTSFPPVRSSLFAGTAVADIEFCGMWVLKIGILASRESFLSKSVLPVFALATAKQEIA